MSKYFLYMWMTISEIQITYWDVSMTNLMKTKFKAKYYTPHWGTTLSTMPSQWTNQRTATNELDFY